MLPIKIISLKNQKEFDAVNKAGKNIYAKDFIMVVAKGVTFSQRHPEGEFYFDRQDLVTADDARTQNPNIIYLGLKVSRKVGNAVTRNKFKRWLREITRNIAKENPRYIGYNFIFIPKKSITEISYHELLEEIKSKLK